MLRSFYNVIRNLRAPSRSSCLKTFSGIAVLKRFSKFLQVTVTNSWRTALVNIVKTLRYWCISLDFVKYFKIRFSGTTLSSCFHLFETINQYQGINTAVSKFYTLISLLRHVTLVLCSYFLTLSSEIVIKTCSRENYTLEAVL